MAIRIQCLHQELGLSALHWTSDWNFSKHVYLAMCVSYWITYLFELKLLYASQIFDFIFILFHFWYKVLSEKITTSSASVFRICVGFFSDWPLFPEPEIEVSRAFLCVSAASNFDKIFARSSMSMWTAESLHYLCQGSLLAWFGK